MEYGIGSHTSRRLIDMDDIRVTITNPERKRNTVIDLFGLDQIRFSFRDENDMTKHQEIFEPDEIIVMIAALESLWAKTRTNMEDK